MKNPFYLLQLIELIRIRFTLMILYDDDHRLYLEYKSLFCIEPKSRIPIFQPVLTHRYNNVFLTFMLSIDHFDQTTTIAKAKFHFLKCLKNKNCRIKI